MSWVRLDDQFTDHPKLAEVGPVAGWVYVSGLCYAARYLTDGFVPENIALRFAGSSPEILAKLVESSLWDRANNGYQIHDYLEYNPPASKVKAEREEAKARMQRKNATKQGVSSEVRKNFGRNSPEIQPSRTPSPSPLRDEGIARPPAGVPVYPQEPADPEYGIALSKLEALGMVTGSAKLELDALWPDLSNGRREWVDDAVRVALANDARTPIYAIRVLAGAIRDNKRPGQVPERTTRQAPQGRNLKKLLGLEDDDGISPFSAQSA